MKEVFNNKVEIIERKGFGYKDLPKLDLSESEMIQSLEEYKENQKRKKLLVQEVLEGWDLCRNNDRILDIECLRTEFQDIQVTSGKDNIVIRIPRKLILSLPSPEAYTRIRRSLILSAIKEDDMSKVGRLIPTNLNILNRRLKREKVLREYFKKEEGFTVPH